MKKYFVMAVMFVSLALSAQVKFGYVNSDRVLAEYKEAISAKEELSKWNRDMETKAVTMENEIKALEEEIKNMSLMVSEERRNERIAHGQRKLQEYYEFREKVWGQGGDFHRKNAELMQPVIDKINDVIKKVSEREKFDIVFDANTGTLLYSKPEYEITDLVLRELNK